MAGLLGTVGPFERDPMTGQRTMHERLQQASNLRGELDRRCRKEESSIAERICGTAFYQLI